MGVKGENAMRRVLVTGANGFIGSVLCRELTAFGYPVRGIVRRPEGMDKVAEAVEYLPVGSLEQDLDWMPLLQDVDSVIHLASVAHYLGPMNDETVERFFRINVGATQTLAEQAAAVGVRRFIYLSSIKVNGEMTDSQPFSADDPPRPEGVYGESKLRAEQALQAICDEKGMELVIIRPPLVYGPNVQGNLQRLMRLIDSGIPLPFGSIDNRRSMIGVRNLCDLIRTCIDHPKAAGQVFLAADGEGLSTPELVRRLARATGRQARLIPFPSVLLMMMGKLIGRGDEMRRLTQSLQVDISKTRDLLQWNPPVGLDEGLKKMVVIE
jgi:nucleoside-diphosphate-sugar epimerase